MSLKTLAFLLSLHMIIFSLLLAVALGKQPDTIEKCQLSSPLIKV